MGSFLLKLLKNKYFITFLAFLIWLSVFDRNNLIYQFRLTQTLSQLEKQKKYYTEEIRNDRQTALELKSDLKNLEKFAREKYLMKKEGEDLYIVLPEESKK
ncbi:MAG TPA: septum formation inhibitor [Bacteroidales bacterium]|nr:septum formation inhibitor [Bacteroidales bacterium]HSA42900.1 septum formation inhibitor [Bacteroidales bacterium]